MVATHRRFRVWLGQVAVINNPGSEETIEQIENLVLVFSASESHDGAYVQGKIFNQGAGVQVAQLKDTLKHKIKTIHNHFHDMQNTLSFKCSRGVNALFSQNVR